jgi:PHD/YefM family antitoxin component YafN of YafNO toxin-antitoxin module
MPKHLTLTEAQEQLLELSDTLTDEPVIITKDGQPVMAAIRYEHLTALLETLEILSDATFTDQLRQSMAETDQGQTISWEEAKRQLNA